MPSHRQISQFGSIREAKEFLVSKITEEANREGVSLSEIERKELYYSQSGWTLPDMDAVNREFDSECDQGEYEKKIKKLVRNARIRVRKTNPQESRGWSSAIRMLAKEDHYLSVMLGQPTAPRNPALYLFRIVLVTLAFLLILVLATLFVEPLLESHFPVLMKSVPVSRPLDPSRPLSYRHANLAIFLWCVAVALSVSFLLARLVFGREKADALLLKIMGPPMELLGRLFNWLGVEEK
jgi:hypothetical protein